ncbi:MAG: phosphoesterase [Frankiales bacterium]|nr:phosphoesterase [Frankiales bacterium]
MAAFSLAADRRGTRGRARLAAWASLAVLVAGCGTTGAAPAPPAAAAARVAKVLTIVEENHGAASASRGMPYLHGLARTYGRATNYQSLTHPSLPNYLAMAGGSTFGVHDDASPARHRLAGDSVFDVAIRSHRPAKVYAEAMTSRCQRSAAGSYAVKHNPWPYFSDPAARRRCASADLPSGSYRAGPLHRDAVRGTLPQVGLLVPDICHDAHDCSLATADAWLRRWVGVLMAGPDWRAGRLAIVVTFDEVGGGGGGPLLTAVVWPGLHHKVVTTRLDHLSWCRWMTDLVHARPLRQAASATSLGRAFGLT